MESRAWLFALIGETEMSFRGASQQKMLSGAVCRNAEAGRFSTGRGVQAARERPVLPRRAELCRTTPQIRQIVLNLPAIKRDSPWANAAIIPADGSRGPGHISGRAREHHKAAKSGSILLRCLLGTARSDTSVSPPSGGGPRWIPPHPPGGFAGMSGTKPAGRTPSAGLAKSDRRDQQPPFR